ncbi:MAG: TonB-dependent receptor plug domain-containing protein, partial [Pseudomonas sp.]|nr:TonB-dependent receptor plug domain-containing protein [Pseudomonas sp.]
MLDLDIEQLAKVQVRVVSARADKVVDAPGVVSRYSREDLEKLGVRTLKEMLSFVPGFVLQDTIIGTTAVAVRGLSDGFNQKVLLLLDDVPYWMPTHSDAPLLGIPIIAIDYIEIVRGPASVMYGTNASAGLIRVATKRNAMSKLELFAGAHGLRNGGAYASVSLGQDESVDLSFEHQRDDGYSARQINAAPVPAGFPNTGQSDGYITRAEQMASAMLRYHRADFNLTLHAFRQTTNGVGLTSTLVNTNELTYQGALVHVDHSWTMDRTTIKLYSDWNNFYIEMPVKNAIAPGVDGGAFVRDPRGQYRWRSGASLNWNPAAQLNV